MEIKIQPFSKEISDHFIDYCLEQNCNYFDFSYYYVEGTKYDQQSLEFHSLIDQFRSTENKNYLFNRKSSEILKRELPNGVFCDYWAQGGMGFQNFKVIKGGKLFFEGINHEKIGFLDLDYNEMEGFKKLNIPSELIK